MKTSRRKFLQKGALAVAGTTVLSQSLISCSGKKPADQESSLPQPLPKQSNIVGVQLYCVREEMKADPLGSLTQLAEMGYVYVEHANYGDRKFYGWTVPEFKKVLADLGLKMISGHTILGSGHWDAAKNDFTDEWKYTVEDAAAMGQKYVVSPWLDASLYQTRDDALAFMEVFNKCGELCQQSGMKYGYHNHDFEFSHMMGNETLFDVIMKNTDGDKVVLQLDIGNMYIAGAKAIDVLKKYPGRYENIHVKDMIKREDDEEGHGYESCIIGEGLIGTKEITDLARDTGTTVFIIEQESYQGKTPMECMSADLEIMKKWGYA
ncbi:TIM barrel protein [Bacteroidota bacterium]